MKIKLIDEARQWYKFWSVKLQAIGLSIMLVAIEYPGAAIHAWAILPPEMKKLIPTNYLMYVGLTVFVLAIIAVFVKQDNIKR